LYIQLRIMKMFKIWNNEKNNTKTKINVFN
jgi:hypothetical protein